MSVSSGPYRSSIPFTNIQQILINDAAEGNIKLTLRISNETKTLRNNMEFGNFVYFTTGKGAVNTLSSDVNRLINIIKFNKQDSRKYYFSLNRKDFKFKAYIDKKAKEKIYNNITEKSFTLKKTDNLYAVVVSYREYKNTILIGNVCKEVILRNKVAPVDTKLYRLSETVANFGKKGTVWPGSAHTSNNKVMAGNTHLAEKHPFLTSQIVKNIKIKDLRVLGAAASLKFDSSVVTNNKITFFSPAVLSRNDEGVMHGTFSFDLRRYAEQNTKFGGFIKNIRALLSCVPIKDVRVYRKTVNFDSGANSLTPGKPVRCGIQETNSFVEVASLGSGLQILNIQNVNSREILTMSFVDDGAKDLSGGVLEYKVEVVASDLTVEAAKFIRDNLAVSVKTYSASGPGDWSPIINDYIAAANFMFGSSAFSQFPASTWKKNLMAMTAVANNSRDDRLKVLETIGLFVDKVSSLLETGSAISPKNINSKIYNSKKSAFLRIDKILENKYTIKNSKKIGLNYVDKVLLNKKTIIPTLAHQGLISRTDTEISKYSVNNPNALAVNKFGYLSPESVDLEEVSIDTTKLDLNQDDFTPLLRSNSSANGPLALERQKTPATNKNEILGLAGIGARPLNVKLNKLVVAESLVTPETIGSENYFSTTSKFVNDDSSSRAAVSGSSESILRGITKEERTLDSELVSNLVDRKTMGFRTSPTLSNRANINGSLALRKVNDNSEINSEINGVSNMINFDSLVRIEYLESYDPVMRTRKPNWKILDEQAFQRALDNNTTLLCKLARLTDTIDAPNPIGLEPLGSLFTIGVPTIKKRFTSYKRVLKDLTRTIAASDRTTGKNMYNSVEIYYSKNMPLADIPTATAAPRQGRTMRLSRNIGY
jgi:hypothetical protein